MELLLLQACELTQTHLDDGLALQLIQAKACLKSALCIGRCLTLLDDLHYFVDVVAGNDVALQNVSPLFSLAEVVLRAADGNIVTMGDEIADEVLQGEQLRTPLNQGDAVHAETRLHRCHLEELVQNDTGVSIALQVNHDTHAFAVALVVDVADAVYLLLAHQLCNVFNQLLLVDAVRNLTDNNLVVRFTVLYLGLSADDDASTSCLVGIADALQAHDVGTCWEVRTFHILHQVVDGEVVVIHVCHTGIDDLAEVVRRDIGGHTDGNTRSAVDQQVRDTCRHHGRFEQGIVEVRGHIDRFLLQVVHHTLAHQAESSLGVTHSGRAVTIDTTEVTLLINQGITHSPFLSHTNQGHIYGAVAVGVILTEHLTHDTCTFLIRAAVEIAQFAHAVKDTAVNRLEAVSDVRQSTSHNDAHRVVDVALLHLLLNVNFDYSFLVFH